MNGQSKAIKKEVEGRLEEFDIKLSKKEFKNLVYGLAGELINRIDSEDLMNVIKREVVYQIENQLEDPKADHRNLLINIMSSSFFCCKRRFSFV